MRIRNGISIGLAAISIQLATAQTPVNNLWHGVERQLHYKPEGEDFVLVKGKKRFNRALYGTNTGFRVETGDIPEFALYLPGMGGNLKFGIALGKSSKWITDAKSIEARYRPGAMIYTISDPLLGEGKLHLYVLAQADGEGIILKARFEGVEAGTELFWAFGGATGKKFSREGDIGADPESSFYLKPDYCRDNFYSIYKNTFQLKFGAGKVLTEEEQYEIQHFPTRAKEQGLPVAKLRTLTGYFPAGSELRVSDAGSQQSPLALWGASEDTAPVLTGRLNVRPEEDLYVLIQVPEEGRIVSYKHLPEIFRQAEAAREKLAGRIKVQTPDPFLNTLGGALAVAADGIWESPTYLHGAVAWRMRLNAWRGAYVADQLGWHDRARLHFTSYANSQVLNPERGPVVADTALHLARQLEKMGTAVFSRGYISRNPNNNTRPHHYDMNLVFFDQMLTHFYWTGDKAFICEMWPYLKRHLAWEKRNFDQDGDGLYDAYAAIWASDALQYSGGGVTHSSAYNYRSNRIAAKLATLVGEDPAPFQHEADKILKALNTQLWMPHLGWYAEYKDLLGLRLLHPSAGLWTIYHAIDSEVPDFFQAYQAARFVDTQIPHIPIRAKGLPDSTFFTISTTNWQPYDWSLNNVALGEVLHTALAYWQAGRPEEATNLWKSMIVESMYLSSSPGGFEQLSFYDAIRGELYRDFADPIGMAARSLVEGLFGIKPDLLADTLTIRPGFPSSWETASLTIPDVSLDFKRKGNAEVYQIRPAFPSQLNLKLQLPAFREKVKAIRVNGQTAQWNVLTDAIAPTLEIHAGKSPNYRIEIEWEGTAPVRLAEQELIEGSPLNPDVKSAAILKIFDPQNALSNTSDPRSLSLALGQGPAFKTVFAKMKQGDFSWWEPVRLSIKKAVELQAEAEQEGNSLKLTLKNSSGDLTGNLTLNQGRKPFVKHLALTAGKSQTIEVPAKWLSSGTNHVRFVYGDDEAEARILNWTIKADPRKAEKIDLSILFNDQVTNIFQNRYLSPRPVSPTLQLPWQGIGNWCYPLTQANIDDSGLRKMAGEDNEINLPNGLPMATPASGKNVVFTSQWDNYPDSVSLPLKGKYRHAYLLMAGSTNPMQTRMDNGEVLMYYKDGSFDRLPLRNPENWWPIEQDFYTDGFAFTTGAPKPYRVYLKTGQIRRDFTDFSSIKGYSNFAVDGGAGVLLDLPLNPAKELKELRLKTLTNDVVIGLMGLTLLK